MGLFSTPSPLEQYIEQATSENNTTDQWSKIFDICDRLNENPSSVPEAMKVITKRLKHENPRVQLQAVSLLNACVKNCGRKFMLKVSEREFEAELYKLITNSRYHQKFSERLAACVKEWAEGDFKGDCELGLIPALLCKLQTKGLAVSSETKDTTSKENVKLSSDPNVVNSQQEEDDIAKAIELSLKDSGSNSFKSSTLVSGKESSLYSSASAALSSDPVQPAKEEMKVRALYDFEAAEENELTFKTGEIILVHDHSDPNWWEGSNHRGKGLFPSNFVTENLFEDEPKQESGKRVSFNENVSVTELIQDMDSLNVEATGEIDEAKIDKLLHILHEADPTNERPDDPTLPGLEEQINAMAPTIDAELEKIDKMHAQLARSSTDLNDALSLYHQLMREMPATMPYYPQYGALPNPAMQRPMTPPQFMPQPGMPPQMPGMPGHVPYMGMVQDAGYMGSQMPDMSGMPRPPMSQPQPDFSSQIPPSSMPSGIPNYQQFVPYSNETTHPQFMPPGYMAQPGSLPATSQGLPSNQPPHIPPMIPPSHPTSLPQMPPGQVPFSPYGHNQMNGQPGPPPMDMQQVLPPQTSLPYQSQTMQQPLLN